MIIPRFSIRWILTFTVVGAMLSVVISKALVEEQLWATAIVAACGMALLLFSLFGVTFLLAYSLARTARILDPPEQSSNPFIHEGALPPQVIPQRSFGGSEDAK